MTKAVWSRAARGAIAAVLVGGSVSCGDLVRQGQASSYLVITELLASGASGDFSSSLDSDVATSGSIFADFGQVAFSLQLKDPRGQTAPSPTNAITVDRYRVVFIRADGRNQPGVDVPYPFDGAFTITVAGSASSSFTLVRPQAKAEPPLAGLVSNPIVISTIAEITFYGHDQTGREVSVTGRINVNFANFADAAAPDDGGGEGGGD
jgi:hypothetical protein